MESISSQILIEELGLKELSLCEQVKQNCSTNGRAYRSGGCASLQAEDETEIQFSDWCLQRMAIREPLVFLSI